MFGPYLCHEHGSNSSALEEGSRLYTMIFVYNKLSKGQHCVTSYSFYKGHCGHNTCCPHVNYMGICIDISIRYVYVTSVARGFTGP